jgi:chromosome segregation ATPase
MLRRLRALEERADKASARLEQLARARDDYEAKYDVCSNRSLRFYLTSSLQDTRKQIKDLEAELAELSLSF